MIVFIIGLRRAINILRLYRITEAFHFIVMSNEFLGKSVSFRILVVLTYIIIIRSIFNNNSYNLFLGLGF